MDDRDQQHIGGQRAGQGEDRLARRLCQRFRRQRGVFVGVDRRIQGMTDLQRDQPEIGGFAIPVQVHNLPFSGFPGAVQRFFTRASQTRDLPPHLGPRALQAYLGHKKIQHTVRCTELAPDRFKDF